MSVSPILNQWSIGACWGYAFLGALSQKLPSLDISPLLDEVNKNPKIRATYSSMETWLVSKWIIKGLRPRTYSPFLQLREPILTGASGVLWEEVGKPPYILSFKDKNPWTYQNAHFFFLPKGGRYSGRNSWWIEWGDKGHFYFLPSQIKSGRFKQMFTIEV
jgi:hypothetical protein